MRTQKNTIDECLSAEEMVAYLRGELTPEAADLVDAHLSDCELCCESLEVVEADGPEDAMTVDDLVVSEVSFKEQLASEKSTSTVPENSGRSLSIRRILAIAASVLLLAQAAYLLIDKGRSTDTEELLAAYLVPYEDLISTRSSDDPTLGGKAMVLYNQGKYAQAATAFEKALQNPEADDLLKLYAGISYLLSDDDRLAGELLNEISKSDGALKGIADWYLGLMYLKSDQISLAKEQFEKVVELDGEFSEEAEDVLNEID